MTRIRVLVIEDSLTVRKYLVETLVADSEIEVVGEAAGGRAGIELCKRLRPDVVTCDIVMEDLSGLEATEAIMAYCPTPILIVSSSFNRGEVWKTLDTLAAGALDVLDKPPGDERNTAWEARFRSTVKLISRVKVISHPAAKLNFPSLAPSPLPAAPFPVSAPAAPPAIVHAGEGTARSARRELVAIGASTGGPAALIEIFRVLPATFPLPILLVLHLEARFEQLFSEWLAQRTQIPVHVAKNGQPLPRPGTPCLVLAPADRHLVVRRKTLWLTHDKERHSCRPSVDSLFESLAEESGPQTVACLLTGMGVDGAAGLVALRAASALTLAQDEKTSVVFGMPKAAIERGGATRVLALHEFAPALMQVAAEQGYAGGRP